VGQVLDAITIKDISWEERYAYLAFAVENYGIEICKFNESDIINVTS